MNLGRTETAVLTNKSGGAVAFGDVVVLDPTNAASFNTTTTLGYAATRIGVVAEPGGIANNASGVIAFSGYVNQINLAGAAALLDTVRANSVAKQGVSHAAPMLVGDFAQVLGTGTTPAALLLGGPPLQASLGGGASIAISGLTGAVNATRFVGATALGAPTSGTFNAGDFVVDLTGSMWVCITAGSPGTWRRVSHTSQYLSADFNNSGTTASNSNLQYALAASEIVDIDIYGTASKATSNTGMKIEINAPTGAVVVGYALLGQATLAAALVPDLITAINTLGATFATGIGVRVAFEVHVRVINSTTAGNVGLATATVTSNQSTVYAGTKMTVKPTVAV